MYRWDKDEDYNWLLVAVCIVLIFFLGSVLAWGEREDSRTAAKIQKLIAEEKKNTGKSEKDVKQEDSQGKSDVEEEKPEGIVCWGDDLINGEESEIYSYQAVLQELLAERGYTYQVIDKTLQGAGTLSMMTMAGVPQEKVDGFRNRHIEAAAGGELPITETGVRDLTQEEKERNDLTCIPVIFMGYYGGWNHDPVELAEQQEAILQTFPNTERFVIVGTRPMDGTVGTDILDTVMTEKWGDHYISADTTIKNTSPSYEGQREIAEAVLGKLDALGYLEK